MSERIGTVAATSLTDDRTEMKCVCEPEKPADGGESVGAPAVWGCHLPPRPLFTLHTHAHTLALLHFCNTSSSHYGHGSDFRC